MDDSLVQRVAVLEKQLGNARADIARITGGSFQQLYITGLLGSGFVQLPEQTVAPASLANTAQVYARDNGSGKTQLVTKWPGGAVTVLATEP